LKNISSKLRQECANVAVMSQKVQAADCRLHDQVLRPERGMDCLIFIVQLVH